MLKFTTLAAAIAATCLLACGGEAPTSTPSGLGGDSDTSAAPAIETADAAPAPVLHTDAVPYATPGADYNAAGLIGPQSNPFYFDPTQTTATLDHIGQWATTTDNNGNVIYGTFCSPVSKRGTIVGYSWQQCGTPGACC